MSYIVVEGPIGVGKTTLSRLIAEQLDARLMLEVVEDNPFLAAFYQDPENYAFKTQAFFLLSRFKQVQDLHQGELFFEHTVSDYLFDKDFIFASLNLTGAEWDLYQELFRQLQPKLTTPDLVVYLRASPDLLLQRIAQRNRPFERNIDARYLRRLGKAYDTFFAQYQAPFYLIEASEVDFVSRYVDRERVVNEILQLLRVA